MLYQHIEFPSWKTMAKWGDRAIHVYRTHWGTIQQSIVLVLNICVVAGQVFKGLPRRIPNIAQSLLSYISMIWLPQMVMTLWNKTAPDLADAWREGDHLGTGLMGMRVTNETMNVSFCLGNCLVSTYSLLGFGDLHKQWYAKIRPLSIFTATADVCLNIYDALLMQAVDCSLSRLKKPTQQQKLLNILKPKKPLTSAPLPIRTILADCGSSYYKNFLKAPLEFTLYKLPYLDKLGKRVDDYSRKRMEYFEKKTCPLPSRGQLKRLMPEVLWEHLEWRLSADSPCKEDPTAFGAIKDYYHNGNSLPGAPFALRFIDYWSFKISIAYPESRHALMLLSSLLHTVERWICYHFTEQHSGKLRQRPETLKSKEIDLKS